MDQLEPGFLLTSLEEIQQTQRSRLFTRLDRSEFKRIQPSDSFSAVVRVGPHGQADRVLPENPVGAQEATKGADHCAIIYSVKEVSVPLDKFFTGGEEENRAIRFIFDFNLLVKDPLRFYNFVRSLHQREALEGSFYELRVRDLMNYFLAYPHQLFKAQVNNYDPQRLLNDEAVQFEVMQLYINCLPMAELAQAGLELDYRSVRVTLKDLAERDAQKLLEFERKRQVQEARNELLGGNPAPGPVPPAPVAGYNYAGNNNDKAPVNKRPAPAHHLDLAAIGPVVACSGFVLSYVNIMHPLISSVLTFWFVLVSALLIEVGFTVVFLFVLSRNKVKAGVLPPAKRSQAAGFNRPLVMRSFRFTLIELVATVAVVMVVLSFIYKQFDGPVQVVAVVVALLVIVGAGLAYFLLRQPLHHTVVPVQAPPQMAGSGSNYLPTIPVNPPNPGVYPPANANPPNPGIIYPAGPVIANPPGPGFNHLPTIPVNPPGPVVINPPANLNPPGPVIVNPPNPGPVYPPGPGYQAGPSPVPVMPPVAPVIPPVAAPVSFSFRLRVEEGLTPGSQVLTLPGPGAVITIGIRERNSPVLYFWNEATPGQVWPFPGLDATALEGVSRVHAHFRLVGGVLYLCSGSPDGNQGARNGTFINGERLEHGPDKGRPVKPNDLIGLGPRGSGVNAAYNRAGGVTISFQPV